MYVKKIRGLARWTLPVLTFVTLAPAQWRAKDTEWPSYNADLAGSRYRPLDQINASNFNKLEVAWRFKTDSLGNRPEFKLEATPLMVNGVVYATAGSRRAAIALDAVTGELLWVHGEHEGERGSSSPRALSGRGLAYWSDGKDERIFYVTGGYRLIALDAKTGQLIRSFGKDGAVDLKLDADQTISAFNDKGEWVPDLVHGEIGLQSAPVVAKDTILIGAAFREGMTPKSMRNNKGYVRGFDVRTGKRLWTFHTIPMKGETGYDTWLNGSAEYTGNTGVWNQITVDEELGLVYLPVESPTGDLYGGHRPGNNLFGESLVCVDLKTGKLKWYFQMVHHPLWDMDASAAPLLMDINVDGRAIKAVALPSKQAFLYVFDRVTGKPVWPIEERPVEKGNVPGEWYAPTQPFPTKPPNYARNGFTPDILIDFTPELRDKALTLVSKYKMGPAFTPPVVSKANGPISTLNLGGPLGGTNWPGGSFDPETHTVYVYACNSCIYPVGLVPSPKEVSDMRYVSGVDGRDVQIARGPGEAGGADQPVATAACRSTSSARGRARRHCWPRRWWWPDRARRPHRRRPAARQASLWRHLGHQSRPRRHRLANPARRHARRRSQLRRRTRPRHPQDRPVHLQRRHARHQEPGHRRRRHHHHSAEPTPAAPCCAPTTSNPAAKSAPSTCPPLKAVRP